MKKEPVVSQFSGFYKTTWPLDEIYSKWILILYKLWLKLYEETMNPYKPYREALLEFMWDI